MQQKFTNLVAMQQAACQEYKNNAMFGTRGPDGYEYLTYGAFGMLVNQFRGGLSSLGITPGDKVAIIAPNSVKWAVGAYATYGLGAHYVPLYEAQNPKEWKSILNESGASVLLVSSNQIYSQVKDYPQSLKFLEHVVHLDGNVKNPLSYDALLAVGINKPIQAKLPHPKEPIGLSYTSGTTGEPKAVILSHETVMNNISAIHDLLSFDPSDRSLCLLPWAHSFGQIAELHALIYCGFSTAFAQPTQGIIENIAEVRPTILVSVPHLLNKIYNHLQTKVQLTGLVTRYLLKTGMTYAAIKRSRGHLGFLSGTVLEVVDQFVFSEIRELLGGQLRCIVSGGAPLEKKIAEFIDNLGISVEEWYGLTETGPLVTSNSKQERRVGSVGKPIPGVTLKLKPVVVEKRHKMGEIIIYGPNVMVCYHKQPKLTQEAIEDGGFRTGDLGWFDREGFLHITGPLKERYPLANGKYITPSLIEEKLKLSPYISNVMVYGENRKFNIALIIPELAQVNLYVKKHKIDCEENELLEHEKILDLFQTEIATYTKEFKKFERPKKFALTPQEWSVENGILTPTLKIKRRAVFQRFKTRIEQLYENNNLSRQVP
ncbi:AMP-binding protein [Deltaproteobacteria bacterium TL4]